MGKSIILAANSHEFAEEKIAEIRKLLDISQKNISDQIEVSVLEEKMSIGIKQMQDLITWSKTKPYMGKNKLAIIYTAELLTDEAQNSVLKLLEEPNPANNYMLVTSNYSTLLPTVLSRCELILDPTMRRTDFNLEDFLALDQLDKIHYLEVFEKYDSTAEKHQQVDQFLLALLHYFRTKLLTINSSTGQGLGTVNDGLTSDTIAENLKVISLVKKMCTAKVTTKNALDYLVINVKFT
jgi:hypothetical protein